MHLPQYSGICNTRRINALRFLNELIDDDWTLCRDMEAAAHSISSSEQEYIDKMKQLFFNLKAYPQLVKLSGIQVVCMSDRELSKGTIIEDIAKQSEARRQRFEEMLQEKYDSMNTSSIHSTLKCRRCGSSEVTVEQKQTRGADEAMTVFCT